MAWIKIPAENHPLFHAALPREPKVSTIQMFGGVAGLVNGNLFSGLFARSAIVKLGAADYADAMKLDGSEPFDPMGRGHVMSNTVLLPETIMDEPDELRAWIRKAFDHAVTLPPKRKKQENKAKPTASKRSAGRGAKVAAAKPAKTSNAKSKAKSAKAPAKAKGARAKAVKPKPAKAKAVKPKAASAKRR